jgi:hypothetical protein
MTKMSCINGQLNYMFYQKLDAVKHIVTIMSIIFGM